MCQNRSYWEMRWEISTRSRSGCVTARKCGAGNDPILTSWAIFQKQLIILACMYTRMRATDQLGGLATWAARVNNASTRGRIKIVTEPSTVFTFLLYRDSIRIGSLSKQNLHDWNGICVVVTTIQCASSCQKSQYTYCTHALNQTAGGGGEEKIKENRACWDAGRQMISYWFPVSSVRRALNYPWKRARWSPPNKTKSQWDCKGAVT